MNNKIIATYYKTKSNIKQCKKHVCIKQINVKSIHTFNCN